MKKLKNFLLLFSLLFYFVTTSAQNTKISYKPSSTTRTPKPSSTTSGTSKSTKSSKSNSKSTTAKAGTAMRSAQSTNPNVKGDKNGKIARSESAKHEFMKKSGYPKGRTRYVIDHIVPLKKGGCDCPEKRQWQTIEEAKKKDKVENP